jgi:hypothetical protein
VPHFRSNFVLIRGGFPITELREMFTIILCLTLAGSAGCNNQAGPQRVALHGKVTLNGTPVNSGSISLLPEAGNDAPTANTNIQQGAYRFDNSNGPMPGPYQVLVLPAQNDAGTSKAANFKSAPPPRREWKSKVEVPAASGFEHNIDLK